MRVKKITASTIATIFLLIGMVMAGDGGTPWTQVRLSPSDGEQEIIQKAVQVRPSSRQLAWQQREFTAFAHFGINTFTGKEWGSGREDPALFNPTEFDARQWARTARAAGMSMIIVTAKHHDGFCLWPSAYTEHSVKNSPWKGGRGDVVREVAEACREHGLKFGFYLSPWDRHEPTYGTPAYNDYYKSQLTELLTGYGEVSEVWMDGAGMGDKHKRMKELYDWDGYFALVRELQPGAVISISGPDVRWVGNEAGKNRDSEWSVLPDTWVESMNARDRDLGSREVLMRTAAAGAGLRWYPSQVDVSIRPGWFYHKHEDLLVRSVKNLLDIYYGSVGGNSQLLLNVPPDKRGLFHERDVKRLERLGRILEATFDNNLAAGASAEASAERTGGGFEAAMTIDNDPETYWMTDDRTEFAEIYYDLGDDKTFNVAMLQEYVQEGQRIEEFCIDTKILDYWEEIACATTVGYKRLLRFDDVTARHVRLSITGFRVCPTLSEFGLFLAPEIKEIK
jgi:alpha-L-fucosidase